MLCGPLPRDPAGRRGAQRQQNGRLGTTSGAMPFFLLTISQLAVASSLYPVFIVASPASKGTLINGLKGFFFLLPFFFFLNLSSYFLQSLHAPAALLPQIPPGHSLHPKPKLLQLGAWTGGLGEAPASRWAPVTPLLSPHQASHPRPHHCSPGARRSERCLVDIFFCVRSFSR